MSNIRSILRGLDGIPNVPFFTKQTLNEVIRFAKALGLSGRGVRIWSDSMGLYVSLKRGSSNQRIFLCSHLDHPGFVFDENGVGFPLGSVGGIGNRSVSSLAKLTPMDLYDPKGGHIDTVDVHVEGGTLRTIRPLKRNTVGMWHLANTAYSGETLRMRSADNHVATAMVLATASQIWASGNSCNLQLVFTAVEEIYQLAMAGLNLRGRIGSENDCVIVVEAMEMVPHGSGYPSYTAGPLIKVNDGDVAYGVGAKANYNLAEARLLQGASQARYQHTESGGYTDATAVSLLTQCPNVATLAVPCHNKHNVSDSGEVVPETVSYRDVVEGIGILESAVLLESTSSRDVLSTQLRSTSVAQRRRERVKAYRHNRARLTMGFYYPENVLHWMGMVGSRLF